MPTGFSASSRSDNKLATGRSLILVLWVTLKIIPSKESFGFDIDGFDLAKQTIPYIYAFAPHSQKLAFPRNELRLMLTST